MDPLAALTSGISPLTEPLPIASPAAGQADGPGFQTALKDAIASINNIQQGANQAVDALVTGQSQNIHQAMIALQQADMSFQLMMQIRNKLVAAYEEIQRMQI
jgi:flagellar hook-basal body complex protein FliE